MRPMVIMIGIFALCYLITPVIAQDSEKSQEFVSDENFKYTEWKLSDITLVVISIKPNAFKFVVAYSNPPKTVQEFHEAAQGCILTINGGYWDDDYKPTDLCISNGKLIKGINKANGHYGLFAVTKNNRVILRDLHEKSLAEGELNTFQQAIKSGPHVIRNRKPIFNKSSKTIHQRSIIGRDNQGRIIIVQTRTGRATYDRMAELLSRPELGIVNAFNLDGGPSTGFYLTYKDRVIQKMSWPISSVIQVFPENP